jgi:hypothetical protein
VVVTLSKTLIRHCTRLTPLPCAWRTSVLAQAPVL